MTIPRQENRKLHPRPARGALALAPLVAAICAGTLASTAVGQVSTLPPEVLAEEEPYRLVYDHVTAAFRLLKPNGDQVAGWEAHGQRALAPVPPDRPLEVVVENANTLLYTYEITAQPVQGGRQVRLCRDVGREALSTGFFVGTRSFTGSESFPSLAGTMEDVMAARQQAEDDSPFGFTEGSAALLLSARNQVAEYQRLVATTALLAADVEQSIVEIAALADAQPIGQLVDAVVARLEATHVGMGNPRLVPAVLAAERGAARSTIDAVVAAGDASAAAEARSLTSQLTSTAEQERAAAGELQEHLLTLLQARASATQTVTALPAGVHRQVTIEIAANEEDLPVRRTRSGHVVAYTRPAVAMVCELSFGVAWMQPPPNFGIGSQGTIVDNADDDVRTSANLMLHVSASALPALGLLGGIGLGSGTAPDLYLGGSMRMFRPLMVNAGVVWQRREVLPSGLSLGQSVDDASRLGNLDRAYQRTAFFGVSFAR